MIHLTATLPNNLFTLPSYNITLWGIELAERFLCKCLCWVDYINEEQLSDKFGRPQTANLQFLLLTRPFWSESHISCLCESPRKAWCALSFFAIWTCHMFSVAEPMQCWALIWFSLVIKSFAAICGFCYWACCGMDFNAEQLITKIHWPDFCNLFNYQLFRLCNLNIKFCFNTSASRCSQCCSGLRENAFLL